jgi:hypothetical protein
MKSARADGEDAFTPSSSVAIAFATTGEPDWMMVGFSIKLNDDAVTNDIVFVKDRADTTNLTASTTSSNMFHQYAHTDDQVNNTIGAHFTGTALGANFAGFIYALYINVGTKTAGNAAGNIFPHAPPDTCSCTLPKTCFTADTCDTLVSSDFNKQDDNSTVCEAGTCGTGKQCRYAHCTTCEVAVDIDCHLCYDSHCKKCTSFDSGDCSGACDTSVSSVSGGACDCLEGYKRKSDDH